MSRRVKWTPDVEQEHTDVIQLQKCLKSKGTSTCPDEVRDHLYANVSGWRCQPTEFKDVYYVSDHCNKEPELKLLK